MTFFRLCRRQMHATSQIRGSSGQATQNFHGTG
jgi:hypothetical protein